MPAESISFHDFGFRHAFMLARSGLERPRQWWLPFGVPQFNQRLSRSVFFLYAKDTRTGAKDDDLLGPFGTGVIVGAATRLGRETHFYAVTAHHVVAQHSAYVIRINTASGEAIRLDVDPHDWIFDPDGPDLAAADVTAYIPNEGISYLGGNGIAYVSLDMFCDQKFLTDRQVGIGEDGCMLGLFHDLPGKDRNLIAARFGNIALLADNSFKVKLANGKYFPAHLFDIRSRSGFSGSPVYIYRVPTGDLNQAEGAGFTVDANNRFCALLGIHVSQYRDTIEVAKEVPQAGREPKLVVTGEKLVIPNSVTVVVPAWEILSLLNRQEFKNQRGARDMQEESKSLRENDPAPESVSREHPATPIEGDGQHKERFTALLDAAVGKRKQGG